MIEKLIDEIKTEISDREDYGDYVLIRQFENFSMAELRKLSSELEGIQKSKKLLNKCLEVINFYAYNPEAYDNGKMAKELLEQSLVLYKSLPDGYKTSSGN